MLRNTSKWAEGYDTVYFQPHFLTSTPFEYLHFYFQLPLCEYPPASNCLLKRGCLPTTIYVDDRMIGDLSTQHISRMTQSFLHEIHLVE